MRNLYRPKFLAPHDWSIFEQDDANARRRLLRADLLTDAVIASMSGDESLRGACMPWAKTWDNLRFRPGEVTLWAGYNGAKKSMLLGQVAVSLSAQHQRTVIASLEMAPHKTLERMVRQYLKGITNIEMIRHACSELRTWFLDQQGDATPTQIYALIRYAATLGMDHVIIDPMLKVLRGTDDYNGQKDFVSKICALAREYEMHIHLVHHARKGQDENSAPRKLDVRGAGEITDQVDNVMICWWNKGKADKRDAGIGVDPSEPDFRLICDKQRNGAWEGIAKLWFHPPSLQFTQDQICEPFDMAAWPGPKTSAAAARIAETLGARQPGED